MGKQIIVILFSHYILYNSFIERTACTVDSDYLFNVKGCVQGIVMTIINKNKVLNTIFRVVAKAPGRSEP